MPICRRAWLTRYIGPGSLDTQSRFFPVLLVVMTFIGLFLLAVSMNEYIDPRSRLSRIAG